VGDLQGNLWRFDISTNQVFNLAKLQAGIPQPITTIPELGLVEGNKVVFLGTGKYLEVSDLGTNDQQSFYAIKDPILATQSTRVNPRGDTTFVRQAIIPGPGPDERSGDTNAPDVNFSIDNGWYLDFPDTRERQNVRSTLFLGTLVIPTTVPESTACQPAGFGWLTFLDFGTGKPVQTNIPTNIVSTKLISPSVGGFFSVNDQGVSRFVNTGADGRTTTKNVPIAGSIGGFQLRRSIWREIAE
jgi:type IV pilus assembly protein PilY1